MASAPAVDGSKRREGWAPVASGTHPLSTNPLGLLPDQLAASSFKCLPPELPTPSKHCMQLFDTNARALQITRRRLALALATMRRTTTTMGEDEDDDDDDDDEETPELAAAAAETATEVLGAVPGVGGAATGAGGAAAAGVPSSCGTTNNCDIPKEGPSCDCL